VRKLAYVTPVCDLIRLHRKFPLVRFFMLDCPFLSYVIFYLFFLLFYFGFCSPVTSELGFREKNVRLQGDSEPRNILNILNLILIFHQFDDVL